MITVERTKIFKGQEDQPQADRPRERNVALGLSTLLSDIAHGVKAYTSDSSTLTLRLRPSAVDGSYEMVTYTSSVAEQLKIVHDIFKVWLEYRDYTAQELIGELITVDGSSIFDLPRLEVNRARVQLGDGVSWRTFVVFKAMDAPPIWEIIAKYNSYAGLDDLLALVEMALEEGTPLADMEQQMTS